MKKYVIKATALAIGALVGGAAVASIDFTAVNGPSVTGKYASELNYSATAPGLAITGGVNTQVITKLGFGVSAGQNRYVRIDLGGAKLAALATGANVSGLSGTANVTVVSGGSAGDAFIIYQITGGGAGEAASTVLTIQTPDLNVTNNNTAPVTVSYSLFETATAAATNAAGTTLYPVQSGNLFTFASGLKVTATSYTNTASVSANYKKFLANGGSPTTTVAKAELGTVAVAAAAGVSKAAGGAVTLADLIAATSTLTFKGDFSAVGAAGAGATIESAGCGGAITANGAATTTAADKQSVSFAIGALTNLVAPLSLCWATDNTVAIPAQSFTVTPGFTAAATGVTLATAATQTVGVVVRDGTILQAPFATIHPDYLSRIVLTSQYNIDVAYTLSIITETGVTCTAVGAGATGTLKANSMQVVDVKSICPGTNTGATRMAVQAIIAAPFGNVHGLYNVMNYDQVTGKTNSLISYPMVRPTEN